MAEMMGWATYGTLCAFLMYMTWRVYGSPYWPRWMVTIYHWKWKGAVMGYFTVRYEDDDEGYWQVIEEVATGNRYRVQVRDAKGDYKW